MRWTMLRVDEGPLARGVAHTMLAGWLSDVRKIVTRCGGIKDASKYSPKLKGKSRQEHLVNGVNESEVKNSRASLRF